MSDILSMRQESEKKVFFCSALSFGQQPALVSEGLLYVMDIHLSIFPQVMGHQQ